MMRVKVLYLEKKTNIKKYTRKEIVSNWNGRIICFIFSKSLLQQLFLPYTVDIFHF